jgi:hypothetical protein
VWCALDAVQFDSFRWLGLLVLVHVTDQKKAINALIPLIIKMPYHLRSLIDILEGKHLILEGKRLNLEKCLKTPETPDLRKTPDLTAEYTFSQIENALLSCVTNLFFIDNDDDDDERQKMPPFSDFPEPGSRCFFLTTK